MVSLRLRLLLVLLCLLPIPGCPPQSRKTAKNNACTQRVDLLHVLKLLQLRRGGQLLRLQPIHETGPAPTRPTKSRQQTRNADEKIAACRATLVGNDLVMVGLRTAHLLVDGLVRYGLQLRLPQLLLQSLLHAASPTTPPPSIQHRDTPLGTNTHLTRAVLKSKRPSNPPKVMPHLPGRLLLLHSVLIRRLRLRPATQPQKHAPMT